MGFCPSPPLVACSFFGRHLLLFSNLAPHSPSVQRPVCAPVSHFPYRPRPRTPRQQKTTSQRQHVEQRPWRRKVQGEAWWSVKVSSPIFTSICADLFSGGRQFSKNLRPIDADGGESSMWADPVQEGDDSSEDSSEEESSEEESSEDEAPKKNEQEMTREERRAAAKAKKDAAIKKKQGTAQPGDLPPSSDEEEDEDDGMPSNPNHTASARKMADPTKAKEPTKPKKVTDPSQLSRREREALQAQQAKERYQKLHAEGKTDEARADLERLKLVREQRAEAAARKEAEKAEREEIDKEKKAQMERLERQQAMKAARGGKKKGGK